MYKDIYVDLKDKKFINLTECKALFILRYITILYNKEQRIIPTELCHNAKMQQKTGTLIFQR